MVEALQADYSVRQISETLGFTRSNLYYHPKSDPSEEVLREEIEQLHYATRSMVIGVSQRCYCVWDTPLGIDASPD